MPDAILYEPGRVFGPKINYSGGPYQSDLAVVDVNHDGYPQLLALGGSNFPNGDYDAKPGNPLTELLNFWINKQFRPFRHHQT